MIHCVLVWFLKPVPLLENDGTLDQQLEACRSMPQHAAACRSMPQHAAACRSEPKFSWGPLVPACIISVILLNCRTLLHTHTRTCMYRALRDLLAPPFQLSKSSGWWSVTVQDSASLMGDPPSLWGTQSAVEPPLLALDSSHPMLNKALGT